MILREKRDAFAMLIRQLGAGVITNDQFNDGAISLFDDRDPAIEEIYWFAWLHYSDLSTHRLRGRHELAPDERGNFARAVLFLHSDLEWCWPTPVVQRGLALGSIPLLALLLGMVPGILASSFYWTLVGSVLCASLALSVVALITWAFRRLKSLVAPRPQPLEHPAPAWWPFVTAADFDLARSRPRLLASPSIG